MEVLKNLNEKKVDYQSLFGEFSGNPMIRTLHFHSGPQVPFLVREVPTRHVVQPKIKNYLNDIDYLRVSSIGTRIVELTKWGKLDR